MRGFVFTLDATVAVFLTVFFLIALAAYPPARLSVSADAYPAFLASDIISLLQETGTFETLDATLITNTLNCMLPANLTMSITLQIYDEKRNFKETMQINPDLTGAHLQGTWMFLTGNITSVKNFVVAEYKAGFV